MSIYEDAVLADSPAVWYRYDETADNIVIDASGNGRDGIYGSVSLNQPSLLVESADRSIALDGATGYARTPHGSWMIPASNTFTYELWVNLDVVGPGGLRYLIANGSKFGASVSGGSLDISIGTTTGTTFTGSGTTLTAGVTYHLVFTYDGTGLRTYKNGVHVGTLAKTGTFLAETPQLIVGAYYSSFYQYFTAGRFDEFAFYPTALSQERITAHYDAGLGRQSIMLGRALESESADIVDPNWPQLVELDQIVTVETARPLDEQFIALDQAVESDLPEILTAVQTGPAFIEIPRALEFDAGVRIDYPNPNREIALGVVTESDHALLSPLRSPAVTYSQRIAIDRPAAYYEMGETSGAVAYDSSGNDRNGSYVGDRVLGAAGLVKRASSSGLQVGTSLIGGMVVPHGPWMNTPDYSCEVWFKRTGTIVYGDLMGRSDYNQSSAAVFALTFDTDKLMMYVYGNTGNIEANWDLGVLALDQTYHVVFTYGDTANVLGGPEARVYLNGVLAINYGNVNADRVPNFTNTALAFGTNPSNTSYQGYRARGVLDEAAYYDYTLSPAQIQAHYELGISTLPIALEASVEPQEARPVVALQGQPIHGRLTVGPAHEVSSIPLTGLHGPDREFKIPTVVETSTVENINDAPPWGSSQQFGQGTTTWNVPFPLQERGLSPTSEADAAVPLTAMFDQEFALGATQESDFVGGFPHNVTVPIPMAVETATMADLTLRATLVMGSEGTLSLLTQTVTFDPVAALTIMDPVLRRAPTSLTFALTGYQPLSEVELRIGATVIWTGETNADGAVGTTSAAVPDLPAGTHTVTFWGAPTSGGVMVQLDSQTFSLALAPVGAAVVAGADAQAIEVPGAVVHDTRHWVFQDLMPELDGGIGSYILPINPRKMSSPHLEHAMAGKHTTATTGRYHVWQAGAIPKEWEFEGYCPTQEMQERLLEYRHLNRRFYIIDHHNRAWRVVITNAEFTPRQHHTFNGVGTDWGSDYTITATIFDQDWVTPA